MLVLEDILEELKGETKPETKEPTKKTPASVRHLGSRVISNFVRYYKPDITKDNTEATFDHVIMERNMSFVEFTEKYL